MIGRAATSAVRRVCSMLAPASKMNPDLNQFFKRYTTHGDVTNHFPFPGDPTVKYTASGELSRTLEVETLSESHNDKPIFYLGCNFIGRYHFTPISLEGDGSLSPKRPICVPSQFQHSGILSEGRYNLNGIFARAKNSGCLFAWNPTTSEIRELPVSPHGVNMIFDQSVAKGCIFVAKRSVFVATWPDPKSEDYKVLNVFSYDDGDPIYKDDYPIEFELYSRKTDSWKKLRWEGELPSWEYRGRSCYINGVIYMKIWDENMKQFILCFDFADEIFSTVSLPDEIRDAYQLIKYNGQLSVFSLINFSSESHETDMAHWVWKNGEWVEVGVYHIYGDLRKPLGFARNDELLLFQRWCRADSLCCLMVFDSTTGELLYVPESVTRTDFMLLDFHDSSSLNLIPPSGEQEKMDE